MPVTDTLSTIKEGVVLVFANWALVVLTLGLLIVTIIYAVYTRKLADDTKRMADIMIREFELRIAPIIVVEQVGGPLGKHQIEYHPVIRNKGSLPVHIKKVILEWWYKGSPNSKHRKERAIDKVLGREESLRYEQCFITLRKEDMLIGEFENSKDLDFPQLLLRAEGTIYCIYVDVNGNEKTTTELYRLKHL
jgi:hypothetical protein